MAHPLTRTSNFSFDSLNKELELEDASVKEFRVLLNAYREDFWQKGEGPLLPKATGGNASVIQGYLEKRFVFRNVIKECVERVAGAFFGKAPNWRFQINGQDVNQESAVARGEGEEDSTDPWTQIDKALSELYVKQKVAEVIGNAFESRLVYHRGGVRIFIPSKYKRDNSVAPKEGTNPDTEANPGDTEEYTKFPDIISAIKAMRVEFIPPTQAKLLDDGGEYFSIVKYQVREDWDTKKNVNVIEFSFVDNNDQTFIGLLKENETKSSVTEATLSSGFPLAGYPTYNEFRGVPYITQAMYKCNQLLNIALTCAGFSLVDNGFGEMVLTNVDLKTRKVPNPDGEGFIEVPERIVRGGGAVQNFVGLESFNEQTGDATRLTPGVTFKEPSALTAFKDGKDMAYSACLEEAGQLHALISGDATASGESRIQALADFVLKIHPYKSEVDEMGSWLLTTILLWAANLSAQDIGDASVVFDSRMRVAALSDAEKTTVMTMREKGTISRETERVLLGIDDPALEAEKILAEQNLSPEDITTAEFSEKLDVGLKMLSVNIDATVIQKYLKFTDEQITEMQQRAADENARLLAQIEAQNQGGGGQGFGAGA